MRQNRRRFGCPGAWLFVGLSVACQAPRSQSVPPPHPDTARLGALASASEYRISEVGLGGRVDAFDKGTQYRRVFAPIDPVDLALRIRSDVPGRTFEARWISDASPTPLQEDSLEVPRGTSAVSLSLRTQTPRPRGRYQVLLSVDGEPLGGLGFEVRDPVGVDEAPLWFGDGFGRPVLVPGSESHPPIPAEWREKGHDGLLIVRCTLTRRGVAEDCLVLFPVRYANRAVLDWLSRVRWSPATWKGEAVDVRYVFNVPFEH